MFVDEVGSDGYGQLSSELFPLESSERVSLPVGSDEDVELVLTEKKERMIMLCCALWLLATHLTG